MNVGLSFAVVAENLVKVFGSIRALDGLSFKIKRGEIYGLIGPNGAGKTTALRIISTLIMPSSGSAKVYDYDVVREASEVRRLIAYLPEEAGAYKNLSGDEYLRFMAKLAQKTKKLLRRLLETLLSFLGLGIACAIR